jgi:hypothetical protein
VNLADRRRAFWLNADFDRTAARTVVEPILRAHQPHTVRQHWTMCLACDAGPFRTFVEFHEHVANLAVEAVIASQQPDPDHE